MMNRDNGAGGERPTSGRGPVPPQPSPSARLPKPMTPKEIESAILRDGTAARLALARQTALKALSDPGVLTPKRLSRLGSDGVARFVDELRRSALGGVKQESSSKPAAPANSKGAAASAKAKTSARAQPIDTKTIGVATIAGWWQSTSEGAPHFEAQARRHGWLAGSLVMLACLALLRRTAL